MANIPGQVHTAVTSLHYQLWNEFECDCRREKEKEHLRICHEKGHMEPGKGPGETIDLSGFRQK